MVPAIGLEVQTSNLDDKKAALELAKECPAQVAAISTAMSKSRGPDGKWARTTYRALVRFLLPSQPHSLPLTRPLVPDSATAAPPISIPECSSTHL